MNQDIMKEIPLTQGRVALVDDDCYDAVKQYKWCAMKRGNAQSPIFYAVRNIFVDGKRRLQYLHRFVCGASDPKMNIDHVDRDGLNCQKNNLRICNQALNNGNQIKKSGCGSKYKGVSWNKQLGKYVVVVCCNYKSINLGYFDNEIEAAKAYDKHAREYFGEFARLNFPTKNELGI